jgi:ABC-type multidrug transport system permease subunit
MRRFWLLLLTEIKTWRRDPISIMGGFIAPSAMLIAFGLLFGGRLSFGIAVLNHDAGPWGGVLRETVGEVISPFGTPYYDVLAPPQSPPTLGGKKGGEDEVWQAYHRHRIGGVWVIPPDFSERLEAGQNPALKMYFSNHNDDRAKNHRIYAAEILWRFYEKIGQPSPPLALAEEYPRPEMIGWFPLIGVGLVLFGVSLGGMFNIFMLTYKEQVAGITLEFGLAPRSLAWVLLPKVLLALTMGLLTGTALLGLLYLWTGVWPNQHLLAVWLLAGPVALFWIALALLVGLRARQYMAGAVASILISAIAFFIGGGMGPVRYYPSKVLWIAWLFPNTHAVDPVRDLVLFHAWPADWTATLLKLIGFAALSLVVGLSLSARQLRRLD